MVMLLVDPERVLRSLNLILEPILRAHAAALYDDLQTPELYTFIPGDPPESLEALQARYERWSRRRSPDGTEIWLNYAVFHPAVGAYVGTVQASCRPSGEADLAYEVFPRYWRRGIAREACTVLIAHLFTACEAAGIRALVDTRNEASWRLLEALGFHRTRTIEYADHFKGTRSDEYAYELSPGRAADLIPFGTTWSDPTLNPLQILRRTE